jgi:predicted metallopeptidase
MAIFNESPELRQIALKLTERIMRVAHIDVQEVLFLNEIETQPKESARCYSLKDHPIQHYTGHRFCIVVYRSNTDHFSRAQLVFLVLHELMHIPLIGDKLIDHNIKDFVQLMRIDPEWTRPGAELPDLLADVELIEDDG